jgi:MFS family permease
MTTLSAQPDSAPAPADGASAQAGTARLMVVVPVVLVSFLYTGMLDYALPLFFGALSEDARAKGGFYPADIFSQAIKYQVTPWIVGPVLAGLLARRYGERAVWSGAQIGMVLVPAALALSPSSAVVKLIALWSGITGALMWIGGVSLVQMVPDHRKGLSNGWMMASLGVGSLLGPIGGRAMLYHEELGGFLRQHDGLGFLGGLFSFTPLQTRLVVGDFLPVFWCLAGTTLLCGLLVGLWGQRPGRFEHDRPADWRQTLSDIGQLAREPRFWALVLTLCVLGGPVFQASNQFLPYRAEDLGLKSGGQDFGWIWLTLLKTLMWIFGGAAVGLLAGRRAPGLAAVMMLAAFTLAALGIGVSSIVWQLFVCVALFEFVRQFMRWSHAGYLAEHMPNHLRSTAIGCSISLSGLGSTIYGWAAGYLWNPDVAGFQSSQPFLAAAALGVIGCLSLFIFDRIHPIRER